MHNYEEMKLMEVMKSHILQISMIYKRKNHHRHHMWMCLGFLQNSARTVCGWIFNHVKWYDEFPCHFLVRSPRYYEPKWKRLVLGLNKNVIEFHGWNYPGCLCAGLLPWTWISNHDMMWQGLMGKSHRLAMWQRYPRPSTVFPKSQTINMIIMMKIKGWMKSFDA